MKEIVEFRVNEDFASLLFGADEGIRLSDLVRKVEIDSADPKYKRIGELQRKIKGRNGKYFFAGWSIHREYTNAELAAAECFQLKIAAVFEPAGESCGTKYDESGACPICHAGAVQVSDLRLDLRKVPKGKDIARTISHDEWIVSQRLAERMIDLKLTGFSLRPVIHRARYEDDQLDLSKVPSGREILRKAKSAGVTSSAWEFSVWINRTEQRDLHDEARAEFTVLKGNEGSRMGVSMPVWHQLVVTNTNAEIVAPTRCGIGPFDQDKKGLYRCPRKDIIGLNLLSEVSVRRGSRTDTDFVCSREFIGVRRGVLRPVRVILISRRVRALFEAEGIQGFETEVAHLISG